MFKIEDLLSSPPAKSQKSSLSVIIDAERNLIILPRMPVILKEAQNDNVRRKDNA